MGAIYEPTGPAGEYAKLAISLYKGCNHKCTYCFAPKFAYRMKSAAEQKLLFDVPTVIGSGPTEESKIDKLLRKIRNDARRFGERWPTRPRVLMSFTSDPYQEKEKTARITKRALEILGEHGVPAMILTKNPKLALELDLDLFKKFDVQLATTIIFDSEEERERWEPEAPSIKSRFDALQRAARNGITTWVSVEPVITHKEGLKVIQKLIGKTSLLKVGPIDSRWDDETHPNVDWALFLEDVLELLGPTNQNYYIKNALWEYATRDIRKKFKKMRGYEP